jgi:hypothetical protein
MAGMGPPPKPGAIRRNKSTIDWVFLPREGRQGEPPKLPNWRTWHPATLDAWRTWWSTPQATRWDQTGVSLHRWALLYDQLITSPDAPVSAHTQITAIEDRHGFSQKAMVQLRWKLAPDEVADKRVEREAQSGAKSPAAAKRAAKQQGAAVAARLAQVK